MIKINLKTIAEQNGHDNTSSHPISTPTRVTFQTVSNNNHPTAAVSQTRVSTTINSENGGCSVRQTTKTTTASSTNLCRWKFHSNGGKQSQTRPRMEVTSSQTRTGASDSPCSSCDSDSWSSEDLEPHLLQHVFYSDRPTVYPRKDYSQVASKVGSFHNNSHRPAGGNIAIFNEPVRFSQTAKARVNSITRHAPRGGNVQIYSQTPRWSSQSKVGSLDNNRHRGGGGNVKILSESVDFRSRATAKVDSLTNNSHVPAGGKVNIVNSRPPLSVNTKCASSKVGSLSNLAHRPQPSTLLIFDEPIAPRTHTRPRIDSRSSIGGSSK